MKKTSKLVILALLVVSAVMTLCACGLVDVTNVSSIEIVNPPKQDYVVGDTAFDWTGFALKVNYKTNASEELTYDQLAGAGMTVSAFDPSEGKHTAIITYMGVSVAFEYTVNAGLFAGGDGTEANPYQIATAEQFYRLRSGDDEMGANGWNGTYFELINDIDFKGNLVTEDNAASSAIGFVLDGNGHAFKGVNATLFRGFGSHGYQFNKESTATTVIKNVDLHITERGGIAAVVAGQKVEVSDVNIYGSYTEIDSVGQNVALISSMVGATTVVMNDINVYADIITYAREASPFVSLIYDFCESVTMDACNYYGTIQARNVGVFVGNGATGVTTTKYLHIYNSNNFGTIIASKAALVDADGNLSDEVNATIFNNSVPSFEYSLMPTVTINKGNTTTDFGFAKFEGAASYKVFVSVWGSVYSREDCNGDSRTGTNTRTVYPEKVITATDAASYTVEGLKFSTWDAVSSNPTGNQFLSYWQGANCYMKTGNYEASYLVFALDSDGNIIAIGVASTEE